MWLELAFHSLWHRRGSVLLTLSTIALGVVIVLGVEHLRSQTRASFTRTVAGVDLIVGARTSQLNLLLYSVFRIGNPANNIGWDSYQTLADDERVAWAIPLSLGDSHRSYRVVGTTGEYFTHFRFGSQQALEFTSGEAFDSPFTAVLGAEVARSLGYRVGDSIVLAHGIGATSFSMHADSPFTVSGILAATGTPVDQAVHVSLQGMEAIHLGWQNGVAIPGRAPRLSESEVMALQPEAITAVLLGLNSRIAVFSLQRDINEYAGEPLSAILPGVALAELWQSMRMLEGVLSLISALVLLASLLGLASMLLAAMQQRQQELALYRAIGAGPGFILVLIEMEALLLVLGGMLLGLLLTLGLLQWLAPWLQQEYGLAIGNWPLSPRIAAYALTATGMTALLGLIPALAAYRKSLGGLI